MAINSNTKLMPTFSSPSNTTLSPMEDDSPQTPSRSIFNPKLKNIPSALDVFSSHIGSSSSSSCSSSSFNSTTPFLPTFSTSSAIANISQKALSPSTPSSISPICQSSSKVADLGSMAKDSNMFKDASYIVISYALSNKFNEALQIYDTVKSYPFNAELIKSSEFLKSLAALCNGAAVCYFSKNNFEEAAGLLRASIVFDPEGFFQKFSLAYALDKIALMNEAKKKPCFEEHLESFTLFYFCFENSCFNSFFNYDWFAMYRDSTVHFSNCVSGIPNVAQTPPAS